MVSKSVRFSTHCLKRGGNIRSQGWTFLMFEEFTEIAHVLVRKQELWTCIFLISSAAHVVQDCQSVAICVLDETWPCHLQAIGASPALKSSCFPVAQPVLHPSSLNVCSFSQSWLGIPKSLGFCSILFSLTAPSLFLLSLWDVAIWSEGTSIVVLSSGSRKTSLTCFETARHDCRKSRKHQRISRSYIMQRVIFIQSFIVTVYLEMTCSQWNSLRIR